MDEEHDESTAVSEQVEVTQPEQEEQRMVPLAALEAERKKRQEVEAKAVLYQQYLMNSQKKEEPVDDSNDLVEKHHLQQTVNLTKRDILETLYQDMNPDAVHEINKYLKSILEKKPWLAESVDSAQNRYARAHEIVKDYKHLVEDKPKKITTNDAERIVQNANKPRSPIELGKSAQTSSVEYLKAVQGKKEFREYRKKLLNGEL